MKAFFLSLILSLSFSHAWATGNTLCTIANGPDTLSSLELSFGTSRIDGSPIISDIELFGNGAYFRDDSMTIPKNQIVNYKNYKNELFILALDNNLENVVLELSYNFKTKKGKIVYTTNDLRTVRPKFVECNDY